jgi:hypothetical protein
VGSIPITRSIRARPGDERLMVAADTESARTRLRDRMSRKQHVES